jgi:DNA invertase Pin-like site-specific DNA recombinase
MGNRTAQQGEGTMEVALYARVSKEEQAEEGASIDQQIADMRALCERRGWKEAGLFVDCENYRAIQNPRKGMIVNPSGERADRPALLKMLALVKTGEADAVVCWRDDRLVRHPRVAVALEDALDIGDARRNGKLKIGLHDATGGTIDRFTLSIKAAVWREENKRRAERAQMGKVATLQQGRWPGVYDRLGYNAVKEEGQRGRIIVLNKNEARIVRTIFDWYDSGVRSSEIRRRLLAAGTQQKGTQKRLGDWAPSIISSILRAEDYTGKATWNFGDGTAYTIEIPRIVEPEQFARVQERVERNKKLATRNAKGVYLLQGMIRCGECGSGMSCFTIFYSYNRRSGGRRKRGVLEYPKHHYRCIRASKFPEQEHPRPINFHGPELDWAVWRWLVDKGIKRPELIEQQILARQKDLIKQGKSADGEIAHARKRLTEINQERAFYHRQAARGRIDELEFDARMGETEAARQYWEGETKRLIELRDETDKVREGLQYANDLLAAFRTQVPEIDQPPATLKALPFDEKNAILIRRRKMIRALCDEVTVRADGHVELKGVLDGHEAAEFDLSGPRAGAKRGEQDRSAPSGAAFAQPRRRPWPARR